MQGRNAGGVSIIVKTAESPPCCYGVGEAYATIPSNTQMSTAFQSPMQHSYLLDWHKRYITSLPGMSEHEANGSWTSASSDPLSDCRLIASDGFFGDSCDTVIIHLNGIVLALCC